jgi:hypothetical protein
VDRIIFETFAAEEGWTPATQVFVLLGYIENQQSPEAFRDYLESQRAETAVSADDCDPADAFMWMVAGILQHPALTRQAEFQEYCGNAHGLMTAEHAAESWWMRQYS